MAEVAASYFDNKATHAVFVGNIDQLASDVELQIYFGQCGESPNVAIQLDQSNGRSHGYAMLEFSKRESYEKALGLDGYQFRGRPIRVVPRELAHTFFAMDEFFKPRDTLAEFQSQLNRRFVPRSIREEINRCPECFLPFVESGVITRDRQFYSCPRCHKLTDLVRSHDEHLIYHQCLLCFELFNADDLIPCRRDHLYCTRCLDRWMTYCTNQGTSGKPYLPCPRCEFSFLRSDIENRVSRPHLEMLESVLERDRLTDSTELKESFIRCPRCNFGWVDERPMSVIKKGRPLRCPQHKCWLAFCPQCFAPWKGKAPCQNCQRLAEMAEHAYWEERRNAIVIRRCPKCSTKLKKHGASNHVVCVRCRMSMCYICREPNIDPTEHFCRCFRDPQAPDTHSCDKMCLIFQDSDAYDALQLRLLAAERIRPVSVMTERSEEDISNADLNSSSSN